MTSSSLAAETVTSDVIDALLAIAPDSHLDRLRKGRGANQSCAIKRRVFVKRLAGYDLRGEEGGRRAQPSSRPSRR